MATDSHLERRFEKLWEAVAPDIKIEAQKAGVVPGRRFVYDFCLPDAMVLLEINGATYARGNSGHTSGKGIFRDYCKICEGQYAGYSVLPLSAEMLTKEYVEIIAEYARTKIANRKVSDS
jgi:very-short-patch-repair endonuclease